MVYRKGTMYIKAKTIENIYKYKNKVKFQLQRNFAH